MWNHKVRQSCTNITTTTTHCRKKETEKEIESIYHVPVLESANTQAGTGQAIKQSCRDSFLRLPFSPSSSSLFVSSMVFYSASLFVTTQDICSYSLLFLFMFFLFFFQCVHACVCAYERNCAVCRRRGQLLWVGSEKGRKGRWRQEANPILYVFVVWLWWILLSFPFLSFLFSCIWFNSTSFGTIWHHSPPPYKYLLSTPFIHTFIHSFNSFICIYIYMNILFTC